MSSTSTWVPAFAGTTSLIIGGNSVALRLLRAVTHVVALVEDDVPRPRCVQPPDGRKRGDQLAVGIAHGSRPQGERAGVEHLDPRWLPGKWRLRFLVEA